MAYVVTGANRGIGKAIMFGVAQQGKDIVACVRNKSRYVDDFNAIAKECGVQIFVVECDLTDKGAIDTCWQQIENLDVNVEGLINCAGVLSLKPVLFTEYEDVEYTFRVNYFAPFLMSKYAAEYMVRRGRGAIINISSMASLGSQPGGAAYDASKAALNQLTKTMAQELAPFSIRVNAVACGPVNTEMFVGMSDKEKGKLMKAIAMKRAAEPQEIARTVLFLLSEDSSYITGQIIGVDGGY